MRLAKLLLQTPVKKRRNHPPKNLLMNDQVEVKDRTSYPTIMFPNHVMCLMEELHHKVYFLDHHLLDHLG